MGDKEDDGDGREVMGGEKEAGQEGDIQRLLTSSAVPSRGRGEGRVWGDEWEAE